MEQFITVRKFFFLKTFDNCLGSYVNGVKEGMGTFKFQNGNKMKCPWVDGKAHGKGKIIIKGSTIREDAEWIDGVIVEN